MKANTRKKNTWGLRWKDKEYSQYKKVFKAIMSYFRRCIIVMLNAFLGFFLLLKGVYLIFCKKAASGPGLEFF